nr:uncharacterized protein LOC114819196 [Malus domestica]
MVENFAARLAVTTEEQRVVVIDDKEWSILKMTKVWESADSKLNGDNDTTWARGIHISLSAKNKLGFIIGDIEEPSSSEDPDMHAAWCRCNDTILSWLFHSLEPELVESVLLSTTTKAVWDDLRERFFQSNIPRIFQLNRELATISQGTSSVSAYFTHLKGLWDELASYNEHRTCSYGAKNDRQQLMQFLM